MRRDAPRGGELWSGARAGRVLIALSALAFIACGNRVSGEKPAPAPGDSVHEAEPGDNTDTADSTAHDNDGNDKDKGNVSMSASERDIAVVQERYAKELKLARDDIKVRVDKHAKVPGITVFTAVANPARAGRNVHRSGVVEGGTIYTEQGAMARVARAWNYGATRTVPAAQFARVMGALHSATHGTSAIIDADTLDVFTSTAYPKQAAAAMLPAEITVDGLPAVKYNVTSGARSIPFSVVTAVVKPDYQVELKVEPIMSE